MKMLQVTSEFLNDLFKLLDQRRPGVEYHIVDSTGLFDDLMLYHGLPTVRNLNKYIETESYAEVVLGGQVLQNMVKESMDKLGVRDDKLVGYGVDAAWSGVKSSIKRTVPLLTDCFGEFDRFMKNVTAPDPQLREYSVSSLASVVLYPYYARSVMNLDVINGLGDYCRDLHSMFYMTDEDIAEHIGEEVGTTSRRVAKYHWHMPFDHCIIAFSESAYVYDLEPDGGATLKLYGRERKNGRVRHMMTTRLVLDSHGNMLRTEFDLDRIRDLGKVETPSEPEETYDTDHRAWLNPIAMMGSRDIGDIVNIDASMMGATSISHVYDESENSEPNNLANFYRTMAYVLVDYTNLISGSITSQDEVMVILERMANSVIGGALSIFTATLNISVAMMTSRSIKLRLKKDEIRNPKFDRASKKKSSKKRRGSAGNPYMTITYSTIQVDMSDQLVDSRGNYIVDVEDGDAAPAKRARHWRRGNFAYYTEEKPLFGKHVGLVWRSATVVNRDNVTNVSENDYSVAI